MLSAYARPTVYLNVGLLDRRRGDRLQMGGRQRRRSLQRPAARECREGAAQGATDLHCSKASRRAGAIGTGQFPKTRSRVSELRLLRADAGPDVYEYGHRDRWDLQPAGDPTRRHGGRDTRRSAGTRSAGPGWPVHHLAGRSRHSFAPADHQGSRRYDGLQLFTCDLPRPPALAAVTHSTHQATLIEALPWRTEGRRGN